MLQNLSGWHAVLILAVVLLVFGSAKLPGLARSVGQSMRILKAETSDHTSAPAETAAAQSVGHQVPAASTPAAATPGVAAVPVAATTGGHVAP